MQVQNSDIAAVLDEMADLLEIDGANPFRVRAYRNAARMLLDIGKDVREMIEAGEDLTRLPGIGKDLAGKIVEIAQTGTFSELEEMRRKVPPQLTELLDIAGLGPKRVGALYRTLGITSSEQLFNACKDGKVSKLPGFGKKTEAKILEALQTKFTTTQRFLIAEAAPYAEAIRKYLLEVKGVRQVVVAGSYRRRKETVGDLDILVTAEPGSNPGDLFVRFPKVRDVLAKGSTKASVVLQNSMQVDMRVVEEESFGACLHYFTGSKAHNIAIRKIAQKMGLKINEYGIFRGDERIAGEEEGSVFEILGLDYIEPELRENRGEVEASASGRLPQLITLEDLKGDLHVHSSYTDGSASISTMAETAKAYGLKYIAIADHSRRLRIANGLDSSSLLKQVDEIDKLNANMKGFTILKAIEVDILEDGSLDLPDEVLKRLDLVVGAIHSKFNLSRGKQTTRILKAMDNPCLNILAHPTGRILLRRDPYDFDVDAVIKKAVESKVVLELNANPHRLDLNDVYCRQAKEAGARIAINTDAHSPAEFKNLMWGIGQARRGWLEARDVINTFPVKKLMKSIKR